jgi:fatty-acyl-CoA synthase
MLSGSRRRAREDLTLPGSLPALLRDRGIGPRAESLAVRLVDGRTEPVSTASYRALYGRSLSAALALRDAGLRRGDAVMLLLETRIELYYALFGAMILGAQPVAVYPPLGTSSLASTLDHLRFIVKRLPVRALATSQQLYGVSQQAAGEAPIVLVEDLAESADGILLIEAEAGDRPVLLQYTSGSLGRPKAIELSTRNIFANLTAIGDAFDMREGDAGFSWLPLYHDMGLHSIFFDLMFHMPLTLMSPIDFLRRPAAWLQAISRYEITHSPAPTFGYSFAARRIRDADLEAVDLSKWRVAMCGAEPIDRVVLDRFADRFAPQGFNRQAFMAAYGLAENTVAVSFARPETGLLSEQLDAEALAGGRAEPGDGPVVVSVGRVIEGHQVRIFDDGDCDEGMVGEIQVRGPSRMIGYRDDSEATQAAFDGEWLRTGDLGFFRGEELFVSGRSKDLIIRGGKNYYPQDVEAAAGAVEGIRPGCVIAFGLRDEASGTERVVVVAEVKNVERRGDAALASAVKRAVHEAVGLQLAEVALVEKNVVPKTTSGKLRRLACRAMYLEDRLVPPPKPSPFLLARVGVFNLLPPRLQRWWNRGRAALRAKRSR